MNKTPRSMIMALIAALCLAGLLRNAAAGDWGHLPDMHNYAEVFGLDGNRESKSFTATMIESNAPGNVFHEGEQPRFTFQIANLTDQPIQLQGKVELLRYAQNGRPGDQWIPELRKIEDLPSTPIRVDLSANGWKDLTIEPKTPETKGGYGLVVDLGDKGRRYLTSCVRTFRPDLKPLQFPKQSLEEMPPAILKRLGVQAIRWAVSYVPSSSKRYAKNLEKIDQELKSMHENMVTVMAEIGTGGEGQPLGRGRPHLDDKGVMLEGKQDMAWLPEYDDEYQQFVYLLATKYGWPKGPITGFDLWNEPWEGLSISGWGADIPRYRDLYKRMGDAIFKARKDAGVDVLVGGCDSSSNTWDKLLADGSNEFLPYLDFCSIHYQGLKAPVLYPEWQNRRDNKGRVLIWDTESWVANTDDRFGGVVATNRAAGYDRSMGSLSRIAISNLSHDRIAHDTIHTEQGDKEIDQWLESRPLAASYGAVQHFIGEREFKEILFQTGLPWVYIFDGLSGNADDGTVVVVGDIDSLFAKKGTRGRTLFSGVRSLDEVKIKLQLKDQMAKLPRDAADQRKQLQEQISDYLPLTYATMTIDASSDAFRLYDFYGNPVAARDGKIVVPLNDTSFFLRADPGKKGSFAALINAIRKSRIAGLEPLEIVVYDMTRPIDQKPVLRLRLTNQLNDRLSGSLSVRLGDLKLDYPAKLPFQPREQKWIEVRIAGGQASPSNIYPLAVVFDAGADGLAVHDEAMHVNWISRRTITVDGNLDDWKDALPQTINVTGEGGPSFEEEMWMPFVKSAPGQTSGLAIGYVAYDDQFFYFATKIADDTPFPGTPRFATSDDDAYFYPEVCYEPVSAKKTSPKTAKKTSTKPSKKASKTSEKAPDDSGQAQLRELRWPEGVRRFSYRCWPDIPSSQTKRPYDNVLIGFNAIPMGEDGWLSHLPGRMPKFIWYKTTDYEYALNKVSDTRGGGTEIWRLLCLDMPFIHFFPRQPKHPLGGPVSDGKLQVVYDKGARIVECAIPWKEIPRVKELMDKGRPVKFSFRVNHDNGGPDMELARDRSAAEGLSDAFHPDWSQSWPNELEFGWEK